jgi:Ca2+-dependent lipid-binding protein
MPNKFEFLELELKSGFLILFGSVCGLFFGTVGLIMAGLCFLRLIHVVVTFNRNDKKKTSHIELEAKRQTPEQDKADELESEEVDDLLLLNPTDES